MQKAYIIFPETANDAAFFDNNTTQDGKMTESKKAFPHARWGYAAIIALTAIFFLVALPWAARRDSKVEKGVNVVADLTPRWDDRLHQKITATLDSMAKLPANQQQTYLLKQFPNLSADIVATLGVQKRLNGQHVDSVVYQFGSGQNVMADQRNGRKERGYFSDELLAFVWSGSKPVIVAVRCLNGIFEIKDSDLDLRRSFATTPTTEFMVTTGWGLNHYVDYWTSIKLAEQHKLTLYRGHHGNKKQITYAQAYALADSLHEVFVTVRVFNGDRFNLAAGTYIPARGPVRPVARNYRAKKNRRLAVVLPALNKVARQ